jgi:hypothetical protein
MRKILKFPIPFRTYQALLTALVKDEPLLSDAEFKRREQAIFNSCFTVGNDNPEETDCNDAS